VSVLKLCFTPNAVPGADYILPRWKGKLESREGSFPANFVEVV
jgi:hypothetical protein